MPKLLCFELLRSRADSGRNCTQSAPTAKHAEHGRASGPRYSRPEFDEFCSKICGGWCGVRMLFVGPSKILVLQVRHFFLSCLLLPAPTLIHWCSSSIHALAHSSCSSCVLSSHKNILRNSWPSPLFEFRVKMNLQTPATFRCHIFPCPHAVKRVRGLEIKTSRRGEGQRYLWSEVLHGRIPI